MTRTLLAALFLAAACGAADAASFDCRKARDGVERSICANPELSDLDDVMARYFHGALATLQENARCLREDQLTWLRVRRARCNNAACLRSIYLERLAELFALQPGINTRRSLPLPDGPVLVWAMAPQQDAPQVASRPFNVQGELRYDEGAGAYVVRTPEGRNFALLPDIMRGGSNETQLASLATTLSGYKVAARGRLADGQPTPFFDHRYCTFIYRMPN